MCQDLERRPRTDFTEDGPTGKIPTRQRDETRPDRVVGREPAALRDHKKANIQAPGIFGSSERPGGGGGGSPIMSRMVSPGRDRGGQIKRAV
ncbi:hypothetical protein GWI33_015754 [Rhynchophorus ferrugineus]|uniref:Uncharacterized protein n=1 Tax=Rhynchophorus ferrugineus TaxID=354439 RepID=A0A834I1Y0_RHYFE|nr:hypothetical protein GWI33_015754 [Rhynchophorus ferrugineus]